MLNIEGMTVDRLKLLVDVHKNRYANMIRRANAGERGFRVEELVYLSRIWKHIDEQLQVAGEGLTLDRNEMQEVRDAYNDQDWGE